MVQNQKNRETERVERPKMKVMRAEASIPDAPFSFPEGVIAVEEPPASFLFSKYQILQLLNGFNFIDH